MDRASLSMSHNQNDTNAMNIVKSLSLLAVAGALALLIASCTDNPVTPGPTEHAEARGLLLSIGQDTLVTVDSGQVQGSLSLKNGETIGSVNVTYILEDGEREVPDEPDHHLGWTIGDSTIATVAQQSGDARFSFHLTGLKEGSTTLVVKLVHVDHDDFVSPSIPVHVEP